MSPEELTQSRKITRTCASKSVFPDKKTANVYIARINRRGQLASYKCPVCGKYHISSKQSHVRYRSKNNKIKKNKKRRKYN